jgi:hypothetical protein
MFSATHATHLLNGVFLGHQDGQALFSGAQSSARM